MLIAPTVKNFFLLFSVGAGSPAKSGLPESNSAVVIDLFAAAYLTKNVVRSYRQAKICARVFLCFFANVRIRSGLPGFCRGLGCEKVGLGRGVRRGLRVGPCCVIRLRPTSARQVRDA